MALSNSQQLVERAINRAITNVCVEEGYSVEKAPGGTPISREAYEAGMKSIALAKGFSIEVFSAGSNKDKGDLKTPRFAINTDSFLEGEIGSVFGPYFSPTGDNPAVGAMVEGPLASNDLVVDIHLVSSNIVQDRVLHAILNKAIGTRRYLKIVETNDDILVYQISNFDFPELSTGLLSRIYSYRIPDLNLGVETTVTTVVPIHEITTDIYMGNNTDTIQETIETP